MFLAAPSLFLQMEFSFGSKKWLPKELLGEKQVGNEKYALGLHAPGFFDKVLNVDKCLLQSEPANMVCFLSCGRNSHSLMWIFFNYYFVWKL